MFKKFVAFASLTALTGVFTSVAFVGCSSETEIIETEGGTDARVPRETSTPDPVEAGPQVCPTEDPIDVSEVNFKPARIDLGQCTEENLSELVTWVKAEFDKGTNLTFKMVRDHLKTISQTCTDCVFAPGGEGHTEWSPLPVAEETAAGLSILRNHGTCEHVVSGSEACGKAVHQWSICLDAACDDCGEGEGQACGSEAQSGACQKASDDLIAACGQGVNDILGACRVVGQLSFEGAVRVQCIGAPDAGSDAGM
jgi:hypothetical protein